MRNRDTPPCAATATDFTPPVSARATTSDTCATSEPKRSRVSPLVRRSIAAVSSVMSAAKRRRRRFVSIAVRASPDARARKYFATASAPRSAASSRSGRSGTPPRAGAGAAAAPARPAGVMRS